MSNPRRIILYGPTKIRTRFRCSLKNGARYRRRLSGNIVRISSKLRPLVDVIPCVAGLPPSNAHRGKRDAEPLTSQLTNADVVVVEVCRISDLEICIEVLQAAHVKLFVILRNVEMSFRSDVVRVLRKSVACHIGENDLLQFTNTPNVHSALEHLKLLQIDNVIVTYGLRMTALWLGEIQRVPMWNQPLLPTAIDPARVIATLVAALFREEPLDFCLAFVSGAVSSEMSGKPVKSWRRLEQFTMQNRRVASTEGAGRTWSMLQITMTTLLAIMVFVSLASGW